MGDFVFVKVQERKYPYFGKTTKGKIVFFISCHTGYVIRPIERNQSYMYFSGDWDESVFTPMNISEIHLIEEVVSTQTHKTNLKEI